MSGKPERSAKKTCLTLLGGFFLGFALLVLLLVGGVALAVSSTGLVKVPVLSSIFKTPELEEDFSYKEVSDKVLEKKLSNLESSKGKADVTLTDDEANTLLKDFLVGGEDNPVRDVAVKFSDGVVKVTGTASLPGMGIEQNSVFYVVVEVNKEKGEPLEIDVSKARVGALSLPSFLADMAVEQLIGFTGASLDDLPVDELAVTDGSISIKGLDVSALGE